jgi:hypothetical protein
VIDFNNIEAVPEEELALKHADIKRRTKNTPTSISGAAGRNVDEVMKKLLKVITDARAREKTETSRNIKVETWQP